MLLALILVAATTALLCWLLFTLASLALPFFVAVLAGHAAWSHGTGVIGTVIIGLLAGAAILFAGQFLLAMLRGPASRSGVVLLFAAPAALAGYNAGHGIAAMTGVSSSWQLLFGAGAGLCVSIAAVGRLAAGRSDMGQAAIEPLDGQGLQLPSAHP